MADMFPQVFEWIQNYGSLSLFFLLALGIVGLPIPDETLLFAAGILVAQEKLNIFATILGAIGGSFCGITLSFLLGRGIGLFLLHKHGSWLRLTPERIKWAEERFTQYGVWFLMLGYFLPGVRHLTGYIAGTMHLTWKRFMLFAYSGAIIWAMTFLLAGYYSTHAVHKIKQYHQEKNAPSPNQ